MKFKPLDMLGLAGLTASAFLIHGYHPYSEDAETYLPGIEKILNPRLFPIGEEYFQLHAHLTWFPQLIAGSARLFALPLPWALFLWQIASFFLFLLACRSLMRRVFPGVIACWAGLALVTVLFTMPVAGTALYLMDPFLNPRNVIAAIEIFSVVRVIDRRYVQAALAMALAMSIHPLMSAFTATFCVLVLCVDRWPSPRPTLRHRLRRPLAAAEAGPIAAEAEPSPEQVPALRAAGALGLFSPLEKLFDAPTEAYERVAQNHRYQFLTRWTWYEMLGAVAPLFLLGWFAAIAKRRKLRSLEVLSVSMLLYGFIYLTAGFAVSIPHRMEVFSLVQPMRSLHLLYVLMLLFGGGLLGEYVLRNRAWRWLALFLPMAAGMFWAQRELYPASAHIEWPWAKPRNPWVQAFVWTRENTPESAIFALDPYYMNLDGEDANGFRAIAQRSQLADGAKDSGVVELFPQIGESWIRQVKAQEGIDHFGPQQFSRLRSQFNVSWVVLRESSPNPGPNQSGQTEAGKSEPGQATLVCPYRNAVVRVCRLPIAAQPPSLPAPPGML